MFVCCVPVMFGCVLFVCVLVVCLFGCRFLCSSVCSCVWLVGRLAVCLFLFVSLFVLCVWLSVSSFARVFVSLFCC